MPSSKTRLRHGTYGDPKQDLRAIDFQAFLAQLPNPQFIAKPAHAKHLVRAEKEPTSQLSFVKSIHFRDTEFAEFGVFLSRNSLFRALRGSTGSPRPEPIEGRVSAVRFSNF
jgi:hypothetical protein